MAAARASSLNLDAAVSSAERDVVRHRLGGGRLEHCFVPQSLLVRPRRRRDNVGERVLAFGALLDRGEDPMLVLALQRPVLAKPDRLGELAGALDVASAAVDDVVSELGLDPDDDAVLGAAADTHVLDLRRVDELDPVPPSAGLHLVEPAFPLPEQTRGNHPAQCEPVLGVPRELDLGEQRLGGGADVFGPEHGILIGRLGRSELDTALALAGPAAAGVALAASRLPERRHRRHPAAPQVPEKRKRQQHEQAESMAEPGDVEQRPEQEEEGEAGGRRRRRCPGKAAAEAATHHR